MTKFLKWLDALPEQRAQHIMMVYSNGRGWTTEPPSRKGLYFACQSGIVYWVEVLGNLTVGNPRGADFPLDDFSHWIGPLLIPEPPSEGE